MITVIRIDFTNRSFRKNSPFTQQKASFSREAFCVILILLKKVKGVKKCHIHQAAVRTAAVHTAEAIIRLLTVHEADLLTEYQTVNSRAQKDIYITETMPLYLFTQIMIYPIAKTAFPLLYLFSCIL